MELYLSNDLSIEQLTKELNDPEAEFYFALADDQAVGFLKVNHRPYSIMDQNQKGMEIERIYVLKDFQGKAIGKFLLDQATRISEEINCNYIWLGVWEHNINAQKFYKKNGFSEIGEQIFMLGNDKQKDLILIKNI
jgi:ribosomal protein S18 acetylase RimI-like enzyme